MHQPEFDKVLLGEGTELLRLEASAVGGPATYVEQLEYQLYGEPLQARLWQMGHLIEPDDSFTGGRDPGALAFHKGALLALRIATYFLSEDALREMQITAHYMLGDRNRADKEFTGRLSEFSELGYNQSEPYHELVQSWEAELSSAGRWPSFVRRGFGFVMGLVRSAQNVGQMRQPSSEKANPDTDWDAALSKLLDQNGESSN